MEKDLDENRIKIEEELKKLPEKAQRAICWTIENLDFVVDMCRESEMTCEEIEMYKNEAIEKEDYVLFLILHITEMYKNGTLK